MKPILWLHGEVKSPPFSREARSECGYLLRQIQDGHMVALPHCRSMPVIGQGCYELRIRDKDAYWRIVLCIDVDAIVILDVFQKSTQTTPKAVLDRCRARLRNYQED